MSLRTIITASTLSLLVGGSFWLGNGKRPLEQTQDDDHVADWFMSKARIEQLDTGGRPERVLRSPTVVHFGDDQTTTLVAPEMDLFADNGPPWRAISVSGWISGDQQEVRLNGDVHIDREADATQPGLQISTADLALFPERGYATTQRPTSIQRPGHHMEGIGMEAWLGDKARIVLHSQVRGHHETIE